MWRDFGRVFDKLPATLRTTHQGHFIRYSVQLPRVWWGWLALIQSQHQNGGRTLNVSWLQVAAGLTCLMNFNTALSFYDTMLSYCPMQMQWSASTCGRTETIPTTELFHVPTWPTYWDFRAEQVLQGRGKTNIPRAAVARKKMSCWCRGSEVRRGQTAGRCTERQHWLK